MLGMQVSEADKQVTGPVQYSPVWFAAFRLLKQ